jgi:Fungal chitosanase of glycosyl hydrolase group 75
VICLCCAAVAGAPSDCEKPVGASQQPWKAGTAVVFVTKGLAVDADGAPDSYLVDGNGLSYTCDGVAAIADGKRVTRRSDPDHWNELCRQAWVHAVSTGDYANVAIFGMLTGKENRPLVQQAGDPLPGKGYISTTTMTIPGTPDETQRHWVDATKVPYIVLTSSFAKANHVKTGDVAVVYRTKTSAIAFGVYADTGGDLGEASLKLHRDLGHEPVTKPPSVPRAKVGIADSVVTLVFPGINVPGRLDAAAWNEAITKAGKDAMEKWGGVARLRACAN